MAVRNIRTRLRMLFGWLRSADGLTYLALMAVALGVRLYIAPRVMVSADMAAYDYWGQLANQNIFHVYTIGSHAQSWIYLPTYPPVAIYLYGLLDKVVFGLAALVGHPLAHDVAHSSLLKLIYKLPGISADLALLTILYVKALGVMRRWVAWLLAATYALSPGILITVVFWGQTDGVVLALVVAGLLFTLRKQPVWAGVFLALAVNFKPQPIVFVPLALGQLPASCAWRQRVPGCDGGRLAALPAPALSRAGRAGAQYRRHGASGRIGRLAWRLESVAGRGP